MDLKNWDPLKEVLAAELFSATLKRQIQNIIAVRLTFTSLL